MPARAILPGVSSPARADRQALPDEARRTLRVRRIADLTQAIIVQDLDLTRSAAEGLVASARRAILELFPDKEEAYRLIYAPRFERAIAERWPVGSRGDKPARDIPAGS